MQLPPSWIRIGDRTVEKGGVALAIGKMNTGKSTLVRYLLERALETGRRAAVVDADIGQTGFGPPTCMTLHFPPNEPILRFIGATHPAGHLLEVVVGVKRLIERAEEAGAELILVDTSGMVEGRLGHRLKRHKIESVRPSTLLVLQRDRELAPLLEAIPRLVGMERFLLPTSPETRSRSAAARHLYRQEQFTRYFQKAEPRWVDLSRPKRILSGEPVEPGALVGLLDLEGETLGLGVVLRIENKRAELSTPISSIEKVRSLQVSSLRLGPHWEEIPSLRP
jgi:polynucleotide 5'-hydroxyl-kinase GRC3/NOL9